MRKLNGPHLTGFATCLSLFIEEKKRRGELAMYVLPKGMEALWSVLRRRSYVPFVPGGGQSPPLFVDSKMDADSMKLR